MGGLRHEVRARPVSQPRLPDQPGPSGSVATGSAQVKRKERLPAMANQKPGLAASGGGEQLAASDPRHVFARVARGTSETMAVLAVPAKGCQFSRGAARDDNVLISRGVKGTRNAGGGPIAELRRQYVFARCLVMRGSLHGRDEGPRSTAQAPRAWARAVAVKARTLAVAPCTRGRPGAYAAV